MKTNIKKKLFIEETVKKTKKHRKHKYSNIYALLITKKRKEAIEAIATVIMKTKIFKTLRSDKVEEMWMYKDGIFVPNGISYIKEMVLDILEEDFSKTIANKVVDRIQVETYIDYDEFFNKQNEHPYILPVKNGLLDLNKKQLKPFTPKIPFFNKINAEYKPGKDCKYIKKFIKEIVETKEDVDVIQEMVGFCLVKKYKYEKAFMLYGSHGRNGKSKLIELIKIFINSDNCSAITLEDIQNDDFALGNLHNKLVNIAGDISNDAIKNTGRFKAITGGDELSANRKFKERINFKNYAKVIFACNELPPVYTSSKAFWLRWVIVNFPYQFLTQKEINALDDKSNARIQNSLILDNLINKNEMSGFLNFAIEGLDRLERQKDFSTTMISKQVEKTWKRQSNSVSAFIEDMVDEEYDDFIIKKDFVKRYQEYCKKHNAKILSDSVIKITLKEEMGVSESKPVVGDKQVRVWSGVKWKDDSHNKQCKYKKEFDDIFSHHF